jgi:hypothetical protein
MKAFPFVPYVVLKYPNHAFGLPRVLATSHQELQTSGLQVKIKIMFCVSLINSAPRYEDLQGSEGASLSFLTSTLE